MGVLQPDWALIAGRGTVLICEPNKSAPTAAELATFAADYTSLPAGFTPIGVTGADSLPEEDSEGGETDVLDLWEFAAARTVSSKEAVRKITIKPAQFDGDVMSTYYGGGDNTGDSIYWAPRSPLPRTAGICIVYIDSIGRVIGQYRPKNSLSGEGGIVINRDDWGEIPIVATQLNDPVNPGPVAWIGEGFGA